MTQKEKRQYMFYAMRLLGFGIDKKYSAILVEIYETILKYKGNVNIKQIISIENQMEYEYKEPEPNNK